MTESKDYLELTFRSINCFADDGKLDADELNKLFDIALKDSIIDENEKRVLTNIIKRIKPEEMDDAMVATIAKIKAAIG